MVRVKAGRRKEYRKSDCSDTELFGRFRTRFAPGSHCFPLVRLMCVPDYLLGIMNSFLAPGAALRF